MKRDRPKEQKTCTCKSIYLYTHGNLVYNRDSVTNWGEKIIK